MKADKTLIKVCGIKDGENLNELAPLKPDYVGFIFTAKSPRFAIGLSYTYTTKVPKGIKKVGVFVNAHKDVIEEYANIHRLDAIQLHGDEKPELCKALRRIGLEVIKVFNIPENPQVDFFKKLEDYKDNVDFFLFDTAGENRGGNGSKFDWNILKEYPFDIPYFISGGIGPEDVDSLKKGLPSKCVGIDINSKFEITPGVKDIDKLKHFFFALRNEQTDKTI